MSMSRQELEARLAALCNQRDELRAGGEAKEGFPDNIPDIAAEIYRVWQELEQLKS